MQALQEKTALMLQQRGQIGPYRLRRLLKRGGMSEVYLAYHEHTHRLVALKVVEIAGPEQRLQQQQFNREVRIMSSLRHQHILPILDIGQDVTYHYIAMPYIACGTLEDVLAKGPLPQEEAGIILEQLTSALQYMHEKGILHGDIKPANILFDEQRNLYLADFGIATRLGEAAFSDGRVMGTPIYMAPELCNGEASESSDIYALGILLYEMLTGHVPFDGGSSQQVCLQHIHEHPTPPSYINPTLSRAIEQVILCAIEKEPMYRFRTAKLFAQVYQQALAAPTLLERAHIRLSSMLEGLKAHGHHVVHSGYVLD